MYLIVVSHARYWSQLGDGTLWNEVLALLIAWHVDGFVSISGWYGIRFSWKKFFSLYGQIIFYAILGALIWLVAEPQASLARVVKDSWGGSGWWFGCTYLVLMLTAPFLDAAVDSMAKESRRKLILFWLMLATGLFLTVWPWKWLTPVRAAGIESCSLITLMFVYLTARTARKIFVEPPSGRVLIGLISFVIGVKGLQSLLCAVLGGRAVEIVRCGNSYLAPHVYLVAVIVLLVFVWRVRLPDAIERFVSFLSPSMFGIYLLHETTRFGNVFWREPLNWLISHGSMHPVVMILLASLVCFVSCLFVDLIRRGLFACYLPWWPRSWIG